MPDCACSMLQPASQRSLWDGDTAQPGLVRQETLSGGQLGISQSSGGTDLELAGATADRTCSLVRFDLRCS